MTPVEVAWQAWRVDGEMYGHTPAQVIGFASEMADLEDADAHTGARHPLVISPTPEPRMMARLRRRRR